MRKAAALCNKTVLVTGGKGFLGTHLASALVPLCRKLDCYGGDVRDIWRFARPYDIVCHLAALNKAGPGGSTDALFDVNVNGTLAVMRYCATSGARCVFASSSAVYAPSPVRRPLGEGARIAPASPYGMSKMLAEDVCRHYAHDHGVRVAVLRIFNIYGNGQEEPFLVPYAMRQLSQGKPVVLKTPEAVRDFIHVRDVARAYIAACRHEHKGFRVFNVGTGRGMRVADMVEQIALALSANPRKAIRRERHDKKEDFVIAEPRLIRKVLRWHPTLSIDDGVALVCGGGEGLG